MATGSTPVMDPTLNQLFTAVNGVISTLSTDKATIVQQRDQAESQLAITQKLLDAITVDDKSLAARVLSAQQQAARLQQLAKPGMALNLHRLPFTQDPNARPVNVWFQPGNTGNTGGGSAARHGTWTITDNDDGSREFAIVPASPFDDFIWGLNLLKSVITLNRALQVTVFEIADEDLPKAMGIETNFEHSSNGFRKNAGLQALLGTDKDAVSGKLVSNQWRYYDIGAGHWFDTGIPFDRSMFGTGKRIELLSEFEEDPALGMHNISLTINGTQYVVDKWSKPKATTWGPYLQQGFQMDSLSSAAAYTVKVWDMQTYWI